MGIIGMGFSEEGRRWYVECVFLCFIFPYGSKIAFNEAASGRDKTSKGMNDWELRGMREKGIRGERERKRKRKKEKERKRGRERGGKKEIQRVKNERRSKQTIFTKKRRENRN